MCLTRTQGNEDEQDFMAWVGFILITCSFVSFIMCGLRLSLLQTAECSRGFMTIPHITGRPIYRIQSVKLSFIRDCNSDSQKRCTIVLGPYKLHLNSLQLVKWPWSWRSFKIEWLTWEPGKSSICGIEKNAVKVSYLTQPLHRLFWKFNCILLSSYMLWLYIVRIVNLSAIFI